MSTTDTPSTFTNLNLGIQRASGSIVSSRGHFQARVVLSDIRLQLHNCCFELFLLERVCCANSVLDTE